MRIIKLLIKLTLSFKVGGDWWTLAAPYTRRSGAGAGATRNATRGDARMPHGSSATLLATPSTERGPGTSSGTSGTDNHNITECSCTK